MIRGELIEMTPPGYEHLMIMGTLIRVLGVAAAERNCDFVGGGGAFVFPRDPDTLLAPDVVFISRGSAPAGPRPTGRLDLVPEFVGEVVSPSDLASEVHAKVQEYLDAGVLLISIGWPKKRSVSIRGAGLSPQELSEQDEIDFGDVIPGLGMRVADGFA